MFRLLFVALLTASLFGCANVPRDRTFEDLARSNIVELDGFANLDIQTLGFGRESRLRFEQGAILTENGPSRFALVRLPQREDSAVITIRSHAMSGVYSGVGVTPEVFAPHVQLFDATFEPIAAIIDPPKWHRGITETFYQVDVLVEVVLEVADHLLRARPAAHVIAERAPIWMRVRDPRHV
jgi:hypothetical protein